MFENRVSAIPMSNINSNCIKQYVTVIIIFKYCYFWTDKLVIHWINWEIQKLEIAVTPDAGVRSSLIKPQVILQKIA